MSWAIAALMFAACAAPERRCPDAPCVLQSWIGTDPDGALGVRFASPLDVNGDGVADIAAGAPFASHDGMDDAGMVYIWSGASGALLLEWGESSERALFGHSTVVMPDLDGDELADVVASAPNQPGGGMVVARSPASGRVLWRLAGRGSLGWDLAPAGDQNGDDIHDLFVGEPGGPDPRVVLLSGRSGEVLRTYPGSSPAFALDVAAIGDQDGDGSQDLFVGAPFDDRGSASDAGAAFVVSSSSSITLRTLVGEDSGARFGDMLTSLADLDGDDLDELVVGAPHTTALGQIGQVFVFSSRTGEVLHRMVDSQPGANYGRVVARVHDIDEDGADDLAIGAPWRRVDGLDRAGYFEVRSGRTLELITSVSGTRENAWLGWHIASADGMIDGTHRGILVSSILSEENGVPGAGRIELYEFTRR